MPQKQIEFNITNIINYIRRSRKDEEREKRTGEDTLAEQKALMRNVLDNMEIPYEQKFEIGSGDKIATRPVFQEVLQELEVGKYDAVAVKEISRLGRGSYTDMGRIYDLITNKRIFIVTPYKIYDPKNDSDLRQIRFEMFLSREEFETIKTRLIGAKYTYSMQGKYMGGIPPYGYSVDKEKMQLVVNEEEAKVVRLIYDLYINGINGQPKGFVAIASYLTKIGIPSPSGNKSWGNSIIKRILTKATYIGVIMYRQTEIQNGKKVAREEDEHIIVEEAHEGIVSQEVWEQAQSVYKNRQKRKFKVATDAKHELTGLVRCGGCDYLKIRNKNKRTYTRKDGSVLESYVDRLRCHTNITDVCGSIDYDIMLDKIEIILKDFIKTDEKRFALIRDNLIKNSNNQEAVSIPSVDQNIEAQIKKLNNRLSFVFDKYESGIYSDEDFLERKTKIEKDIGELKKSKEDNNSENTSRNSEISRELFIEKTTDIYNDFVKLREEKKSKEINDLLKTYFDEIKMTITQKGKRNETPKFSLDISMNPMAFLPQFTR